MAARIICFGETLWDVFPDKKVIGGAPLNVALRLYSLGSEAAIISRVGNDQDGKNMKQYLNKAGFDCSMITTDLKLTTGNVQVHLDQNNTASYTISKPVAWDNISIDPNDVERISQADAFIYGSLCCRNSISRNTLFEYLTHAKFKVFDANLRPPHYTMPNVFELMNMADMVKLNDDELEEICQFLQIDSKSIDVQIKDLSRLTNTDNICITLGAKGAVFYADKKYYTNPGYKVLVQDTVGAGDSFLASLVYHFILGTAPQEALDFACAMGSLVASKKGANPDISRLEIENLQKMSS